MVSLYQLQWLDFNDAAFIRRAVLQLHSFTVTTEFPRSTPPLYTVVAKRRMGDTVATLTKTSEDFREACWLLDRALKAAQWIRE